jgi:hypothetical protein
MGIEAFNVRVVNVAHVQVLVESVLRAELGFVDEMQSHPLLNEVQLRYEDAAHIVECELQIISTQSISLRFALCQPTTIDTLFVGVITRIISRLGGEVFVPVGTDEPTLNWFDGGAAILTMLDAINAERMVWQQAFGDKVLKASCSGALKHFVLNLHPR